MDPQHPASSPAPQIPSEITTNQQDPHLFMVVVNLVYFYPLGLVMMWLFMKRWPFGVKITLTLPLLLIIIGSFFAYMTLSNLYKTYTSIKNPYNFYNDLDGTVSPEMIETLVSPYQGQYDFETQSPPR